MELPAVGQPTPGTAKSHRKLVETLMYILLGLLALAFVILQTNANRKYEAELTEKLSGSSFVLSRWDSSGSGTLHTMNNIVMLLKDGIAIRINLDSTKEMYADETIENATSNEQQETSTHNEEAGNWSVHVSLFNRITVKVGETTFVVHQDEFGMIDYLIEDGYKLYYQRSTY